MEDITRSSGAAAAVGTAARVAQGLAVVTMVAAMGFKAWLGQRYSYRLTFAPPAGWQALHSLERRGEQVYHYLADPSDQTGRVEVTWYNFPTGSERDNVEAMLADSRSAFEGLGATVQAQASGPLVELRGTQTHAATYTVQRHDPDHDVDMLGAVQCSSPDEGYGMLCFRGVFRRAVYDRHVGALAESLQAAEF